MTIIPFSVPAQESLVFDPSTLCILSDAFEQAWQSVQASGQADTHEEETRELLAKCILERAKLGDRNKDRLRQVALIHLAQVKLARAPRPRASDRRRRLTNREDQRDDDGTANHAADECGDDHLGRPHGS